MYIRSKKAQTSMGNLPPMAAQPARETRVLQYRVLLQPQHTHTETYSLLCKARPLNLTAPHRQEAVCSVLEDQRGCIRAAFVLQVVIQVCRGLGAKIFLTEDVSLMFPM